MNAASLTHRVRRVSPMLPVADMEVTLKFYTAVLGFRVLRTSPGYSIVERNGATIHLMKAADESVLSAVRGRMEIYIEVDDLNLLWNHVKSFKDQYRIREPFEQPYGMTEFHIGDPDDCLVFVGQPTTQPT